MNAFSQSMISQECRLLRWLNHGLQHRLFCNLMIFASRLGDGVIWYTMLVIVLWWQGLGGLRSILAGMFATTICVLLFKLLKRRTTRLRPFEVMDDLHTAIPPIDEWSFPSGHAMNAFSVATVISLFYGVLAPIVWPIALVIAMSRIALGLHYPSDVLAGAVLGSLIGALSTYLFLVILPF